MSTREEPSLALPVKRGLQPAYISSLFVAGLMTVQSVLGLMYRDLIYPTEELTLAFVPNDVVNILIGLPVLLVSLWLTRRGKLVGLLFWPGALFYVLYNYLIYLFAMPLSMAFLLHLALVTLSAYTLFAVMDNIDRASVQKRITGAVPERFAGGVLAGLGILFFLRVLGIFVSAINNHTAIPETEVALNVSDFLISPAVIIGGILLWRRKALGYAGGLGLLFQQSMLFIALIVVLLLQPSMTGAPLALIDIAVVFIMGLICFIPFALFVRGVASSTSN